MLSRSTLKEFKEIYVDSLKPQNHNWTWRDMERLMEVYISHEDQGIETSKKSRSSSSSSRTKFINVASEKEESDLLKKKFTQPCFDLPFTWGR